MKVTDDQIREALKACEGRVAQAARVLGIARNNLYKRMANKGIAPAGYRRNVTLRPGVTGAAHAVRDTRPVAKPLHAVARSEPDTVFGNAISRGAKKGRSLRAMDAVTTNDSEPEPKQLRLSRSIYLRPDQIQALNDACLDLTSILREKLSPSKVLERFIDGCFAPWVEQLKKPAATKRKKGEE